MDYYDRDGQTITMGEWARLFEDKSYQRVDRTKIGDVEVSTVWLGLNHGPVDGPPLIYETMIFGGTEDGRTWRYSDEYAAVTGHARAVDLVRDATRRSPRQPGQ